MRYTLITFLACPACSGSLAAIPVMERPAPIPVRSRVLGDCVPAEGAIVAPLLRGSEHSPIRAVLERYASAPAAPARDYEVEIETGLLVCLECARWFPITRSLPELLPDYLRDRDRDARAFEECASKLPPDLIDALNRAAPAAAPAGGDRGVAYKQAEIGIKTKVDGPEFFSPGYSSPFNPHDTNHTLYLIKLFGSVIPLLDLKNGDVLLDSGCGYAWTTEWMYKAGVEAIGVDICRTYLDVGVERMGPNRPHLIVADVEHLPLKESCTDAVFAFETAHHWPDRKSAMKGFGRVLRSGGRVVLAEPGSAHEHAHGSQAVMDKYGILEKGMELEDVQNYVSGSELGPAEQVFVLHASNKDAGKTIDRVFAQAHSALEANVFRARKREGLLDAASAAFREPRRVVWPKMKRHLRAALIRLGLE